MSRHPSITQAWLGRRLDLSGIHSRILLIGGRRARGYQLTDFTQPFASLLSGGPIAALPGAHPGA